MDSDDEPLVVLDAAEAAQRQEAWAAPAAANPEPAPDSEDSEMEDAPAEPAAQPAAPADKAAALAAIEAAASPDARRAAREAMAAQWPLEPAMWLAWADDEPAEARPALLERALGDFSVPSLWLAAAEAAEEPRAVLERAVEAAGDDFEGGGALWTALAEAERAAGGGEEAATAVLLRRLLVPLADNEAVLGELSARVEHGAPELKPRLNKARRVFKNSGPVAARMAKALRKAAARAEAGDAAGLAKHVGAAARAAWRGDKVWFHAAQAHPAVAALWLRAGEAAADAEARRAVLERAARHCPWEAGVWVALMRAAEEGGGGLPAVLAVGERALAATLASYEGYVHVWLAVADCARRGGDAGALERAFAQAGAWLDERFPGWDEGWLALQRYRALCLRVDPEGGRAAARLVWEGVVARMPTALHAWGEYAAFEAELAAPDRARAVFRRALAAARGSKAIDAARAAWVDFERQRGADLAALHRAQTAAPAEGRDPPKLEALARGIALRATQADVERHFRRCGPLSQVQLRGAVVAGKRAALLVCADRPTWDAVLAWSGRELCGAPVGVTAGAEAATSAKMHPTTLTVNVPLETTPEQLRAAFAGVVHVGRGAWHRGRQVKPFALVGFESEEAKAAALALGSVTVAGRAGCVIGETPLSADSEGGWATASLVGGGKRGRGDGAAGGGKRQRRRLDLGGESVVGDSADGGDSGGADEAAAPAKPLGQDDFRAMFLSGNK